MEKRIKIVKDNKKLFEFLNLPQEYYSEKIPDSILTQINKAKSKERSDIPTYLWTKNKYAESDCLEKIIEMYKEENIDIIDYETTSLEEFREKYEKTMTPCKIRGISEIWKKKYSFKWSVM